MTREAVVVVPENAAAGKVNGKQLAATAPLHGQPRALSGAKTPAPQEPGAAPGPASPPRAAGDTGVAVAPGAANAEGVVVRAEARHNDPRGLHKTADEFMQVRRALHLRVGARVLLTQNHIWGVPTVTLGLMNGARGVVVAILYAPDAGARADGHAMAGAGHPSSTPGVFPRGPAQCPLPDFVVVHFPQYKPPPHASQAYPGLGCQSLAWRCNTSVCRL